MKTIIKIKTWGCGCGYHQDFEPTQANQNLHFNNDSQFRVSNLKANECPSCALKEKIGTLVLETEPSKKTTITIMGEEEVETHEVDDETKQKDENGNRPKRKLNQSEKNEMITKIRSDIEKFRLLEDK